MAAWLLYFKLMSVLFKLFKTVFSLINCYLIYLLSFRCVLLILNFAWNLIHFLSFGRLHLIEALVNMWSQGHELCSHLNRKNLISPETLIIINSPMSSDSISGDICSLFHLVPASLYRLSKYMHVHIVECWLSSYTLTNTYLCIFATTRLATHYLSPTLRFSYSLNSCTRITADVCLPIF